MAQENGRNGGGAVKSASDELISLIAMAEGMGDLARQGGASGYAISGMFDRLITRIRAQDAQIKQMDAYVEAAAKHYDETAAHYRDAYRLFAGTEGHRKLAGENEAKAAAARAARKEPS